VNCFAPNHNVQSWDLQDSFIDIDQHLQADFNSLKFNIRDLEGQLSQLQKQKKQHGKTPRTQAGTGDGKNCLGEKQLFL
jgi:hypothetical protein